MQAVLQSRRFLLRGPSSFSSSLASLSLSLSPSPSPRFPSPAHARVPRGLATSTASSKKDSASFAEAVGMVSRKLVASSSMMPFSLRDRPRPASPSFYTGTQRSTFHDFGLLLQKRIEALENSQKETGLFVTVPPHYPTWITKQDLQSKLECRLRTTQYRMIVSKLNEIYNFWYSEEQILRAEASADADAGPADGEAPAAPPQPASGEPKLTPHQELSNFLNLFRRSVLIKEVQKKVRTLDQWGRMRAVGRRKDSVARVYVAKGQGEILVNGLDLAAYFPEIRQRENVIAPLALFRKLDCYNTWIRVEGGGLNAQSEAIRLGLSRCMEYLDESTRPTLRKAGFLTRDSRVVEAKKPGRKKARKLKQWVKR